MNNRVRLVQASIIVTIGIILSLMTVYVPIFSILSLLIPVPYAMIATLTDNKYSFLSLIATFFILIFMVDPLYSISICIMSVLPGISIGTMIKRILYKDKANKFDPLYIGTIVFVISTIMFGFIASLIFNINIVDNFTLTIKEAMNIQLDILKSTGVNLKQDININSMVDFFNNLLPTILFLQAILTAFIVYYIEVFILKRIKMINLSLPKITEFYLPGNAIIASLIMNMLVLFIGSIGINIYTDLVMINLQLVFNFMFIIQGISICIYFFVKWVKQRELKMILIYCFILFILGFIGISFIGMLDSIVDFRKVRSYKST